MKRLLSILISLVLTAATLAACGDSVVEPEYSPPETMTEQTFEPSVEPTENWVVDGYLNGDRIELWGYELFDFDGNGVPYRVNRWYSPDNEVIHPVTLYRYQNGEFEFAKVLSDYRGVGFHRAEDGRLFTVHSHTVGFIIDWRLLTLGDEITLEPVLSTNRQTGAVHNHLTGETFERYEPPIGRFVGIAETDSWEEEWRQTMEMLLGFPLTRVEPINL